MSSDAYYNSLFPEVRLLYRLNLLYQRLKRFLSDWMGIDINSILSAKNRAFVRGILAGKTNKELFPQLNFDNEVDLRKEICNKLSFFIKQFFKLNKMTWPRFGFLLQEKGYQRLPLEIELQLISTPIPANIKQVIAQIERTKVTRCSQSTPTKTDEQRTDSEKQIPTHWDNQEYTEAVDLYVKAIDGNVKDKLGSNLLLSLVLDLHYVKAYCQCSELIDYALSKASDRYDRSFLYLCKASYFDELSLKYCCDKYWRMAQNEFDKALSAYEKNILAAWSKVKSSIVFHLDCQFDPQDETDYLTIARHDFNEECKTVLQIINKLPPEVKQSIQETLPRIPDNDFRTEITNAIAKF